MSMLMGARGVGALLGPLAGGRWAQHRESRLRTGILVGFFVACAGYVSLGMCTSFAIALLSVMAAHAGTSTNWVFSSTLLQIHTEDRFRGRVFSADYGLCMLAISASSYLAGIALDFRRWVAHAPPRNVPKCSTMPGNTSLDFHKPLPAPLAPDCKTLLHLRAALAAVGKLGDALLFGQTSDGGRLALHVLSGGHISKFYCGSLAECEEILEAVRGAAESALE
jgi:hypothetical protein